MTETNNNTTDLNPSQHGEGIKINIKPLDITNQATFTTVMPNFEDPDDTMAVINGPRFPKTHPQEYRANVNLHANGGVDRTIFNDNLAVFGGNLLNSGFGYYVSGASSTVYTRCANFRLKDFSVGRTGNLTIFNETNIEVQNNAIPRGQNMENNYGPNTIGRHNNVVGNFVFDIAKTVPNTLMVHNFLNRQRSGIGSAITRSDTAYVMKISTLDKNIRDNTPFPGFTVPFPDDSQIAFLDFSSLRGVSTSPEFWYQLNDVSYTPLVSNVKYYVDMSNTIEGSFGSSTTITIAHDMDCTNTPVASQIARILDDTLTRQDIRWALFLGARPLPRFLTRADVSMSGSTTGNYLLDVYLPLPHNRDTYLKWLTKTNYDHNEYTLSAMIADHKFACDLIRDVRICKTFLYQVSAYTCKISYIPDSNSLFTPARYSQLLGFNLVNIGDLYTATFLDTSHQFSKWFAWIPYELAKSTNNTVKFDEPRWRRSRLGLQVADKVKRPRSIAVADSTTQPLVASNILDDAISMPTRGGTDVKLTIKALPCSLYWEKVHGDVFTITFSEDDLLENNFLEDYDYFPDFQPEESWN